MHLNGKSETRKHNGPRTGLPNSTLCSVVKGPRQKELHDTTGQFSGMLTSGLCLYFFDFLQFCVCFLQFLQQPKVLQYVLGKRSAMWSATCWYMGGARLLCGWSKHLRLRTGYPTTALKLYMYGYAGTWKTVMPCKTASPDCCASGIIGEIIS